MKKVILGALLLFGSLLPLNSTAQHYVYHNIGDTIYGRDTIYHYQWWSDEFINPDTIDDHLLGYYEYIAGPDIDDPRKYDVVTRYCYTDHPINIIGIAASFTTYHSSGYQFYGDTTDRQEYLCLYDATPDSFPLKAYIPWHYADPHRYLSFYYREPDPCCPQRRVSSAVVPVYEYYFERAKPLLVEDSFYIGGTYYSLFPAPETTYTGFFIPSRIPAYYGYDTRSNYHIWDCTDDCPQIPLQLHKQRLEEDQQWYWTSIPSYLFFFPIIEIDTSFFYQWDTNYVCPPIENLRRVGPVDGTAWLLWNDNSSSHIQWQYSYGPSGTPPGEGILDSVSGNPIGTLDSLDSCTHYVAYVRALCEHRGNIYYSEWSDSISIFICDTTQTHEGITDPGNLDRYTSLVPNPATQTVQVLSSFGLQQVAVYNLKGQQVLNQQATGLSSSFDVSHWPKGTYIVVLRTPQGIATKKLLVQ